MLNKIVITWKMWSICERIRRKGSSLLDCKLFYNPWSSKFYLCFGSDFVHTLPCLVPIVDIDTHALGEEVVEYVYPVKDSK